MDKEQFKALRIGQTIYHASRKNADGSRLRARVNGAFKEWKRTGEWRIPMKYGFRECFYIGSAMVYAKTNTLFANPANWLEEDN